MFALPKKASVGPQMMMARALFKKYGIVFLNKGRTKQEQKEGNEARDGSRWLAYDLSAFVTSKWAANMSRSEGSTFWIKLYIFVLT